MRLLSLESKVKRGYRAARWQASILTARVTGHPSSDFFKKQVRPDAWRLPGISVFPERDVVFTAIAKNANSKVRRILSEARGVRNPLVFSGSRKFRRCPSARDIPIQEFYRILNSPDRLSFVVVRDPYERIFSAWANKFRGRPLVRRPIFQAQARELNIYLKLRPSIDKSLPAGPDATLGFDDFLNYVSAIIGTWTDAHIEPQSSYLDVPFVPIDHMVRLETFSRDMLPVLDHMKAPKSIAMRLNERVNASGLSKKDYALTPVQKKKIEALYHEDIERFGYRR